ncbi:unnamed protein product [Brassica rapa]|uniref:THH1/TOM1/TOM3 domain-containing protein n=1 Tax=Brassica campestris TaxID=3711 RepID=A0A3P5YVM8_BRACM|nr:unnamed protein product [Brassica rapa]VDC63958.1 unnamed protein product [Brassica rapa]
MRTGGLEAVQSLSSPSSSAAAVIALNLKDATSWWLDVNESPFWQDRILRILAGLYGIVSVIAVARSVSTDGLKESFFTIALWLILRWKPVQVVCNSSLHRD